MKFYMRGLIYLFLIFANLPSAFSVSRDEGNPSDQFIHHEGQIVSVLISRKKPIRIFVMGKEEAQFNLKDVSLTLRRLKPYPGKVLKLNRYGNYFEVDDEKEFNKIYDLEISTQLHEKQESFQIHLKDKP